MPNFRNPSQSLIVLISSVFAIAIISLDVRPAFGADFEPTGRSSTSISSGGGSAETSVRTRFQAGNFKNQTLGVSGVNYSIGLGIAQAGSFEFYGEIPFLWGDNRGAPVQEIGNPRLGMDVEIVELGDFRLWGRGWAAISQPSGKLASRFDTYRAGGELRYRRHRYFSSMGAGHRFRVNEKDSVVDVGDMSDFDFSLGYSLGPNWSGLATLEWLYTDGVKARGMVYARASQWAGVSPGIRYRGSGGLEVTTALMFPILQSRDEQEMEIAFWDMSVPPVSQVSLRTQVGVWF